MYNFFLIIFFIICILLTTSIILTPSKNNIIGSSIDNINLNKNTITSKFFKDTMNYTITILAISFYIISLTLNCIYNKKIKNNLINQKKEIKIIKKK